MKIYVPFKKWFITQGFAQNANTYYKEGGLKGHTGMDIMAIGDTNMYAGYDGYCYSVVNKDNPDLMRYRAVYTLIEDTGVFYELSYGHCNKIFVQVGDVKRGDLIATEGNTGDVASGGKKVTAEEKKDGSRKGAHLHFQLRLVIPVSKVTDGKKYLSDSKGKFKKNGKFFEIVDYKNGYKGCVDMSPYLVNESAYKKPIIDIIFPINQVTSTLKYGSNGHQVKLLQKLLGVTVDGSFGIETLSAVKKFQKLRKLTVDGIVGKLTTHALYNQS